MIAIVIALKCLNEIEWRAEIMRSRISKLNILNRISVLVLACLFISASLADVGEWRRYQNEGIAAYENKSYKLATKKFKKAIDIAEDDLSRSKYHAKSLYYYGLTLHQQGKTNKGISYMEKAHKYMRKKLGKRHEESLGILEGMANIRLDSNRPQYAEPLYRTVLKHRLRELGETHALVTVSRERLAKTLLLLDKNDEAVELIELAIKSAKKNNSTDVVLAGMYEIYAEVLVKIGEKDKAEKITNRAMEIRSTIKAQSAITAPVDHGFKLSKTAGEYKEPPSFSGFKTTLINKGYNFSEEYMHRLCKNKKLFTLVDHCIVYWFKSKQRTRIGIYPIATFKVVQYGDQSSAEIAFNNLKSSASSSSGLNYQWDHIVVHGNHLYWLNAGCSFSKDKWASLVSDFNLNFAVSDESTMPKLSCKCGGGCK